MRQLQTTTLKPLNRIEQKPNNPMQQITFLGLKQIPFFSHLPETILKALADKAKPVKFAKGDTIITEGEQTSSLYVVVSGRAKVLTSYDVGKAVDLLILEPGAYFGEMALLTDEPRAATVTAMDKVTCAAISKPDFKSWLKDHPDIDINLQGILSEKIGYLSEKTQQIALSSVYEKTTKVLRSLAQQQGNSLVIPIQPSHQELAELVGASPKMVKQVMKELSKGGYVESKNKSLRISSIMPESW